MSVRSCANMLRKHFAVFSSVCFSAAVFAAAPAEEFEALPVTDRHFAALRQEHPQQFLPGNFDTLTSAYRDSYWGRRFGNRMLHDAEQLLAMPPLPRRMIGRRLLKTSQAEVRRIGLLATAFRLTGERRFAERARAEMLAVCAYDDWNPAHFLDVAEMTFALALGYDWLHDTLPPEERDTIASAILEKGRKPSFDKTFKQSWVAGDYNWTQVCHGGLAAGALAVYERDPQLARQVIRRAVAAMPKVMAASYRGNGAYPEGVGYWAYGTNYNTLLIEMLENAFGTGFGLTDYPGLEESGEFVRACILPSGHKFACSDTGRESRVGLNYANVYLMVRRGKSGLFDRYMRNFLADYTAARPQKHHPADQRLAAPMLPLLARLPEQAATGGSTVYFSTDRAPVPVAVMRTDWSGTASALAMKGGRPSGSHGHMDSGEFVVEIDGIPVAVDLGSAPRSPRRQALGPGTERRTLEGVPPRRRRPQHRPVRLRRTGRGRPRGRSRTHRRGRLRDSRLRPLRAVCGTGAQLPAYRHALPGRRGRDPRPCVRRETRRRLLLAADDAVEGAIRRRGAPDAGGRNRQDFHNLHRAAGRRLEFFPGLRAAARLRLAQSRNHAGALQAAGSGRRPGGEPVPARTHFRQSSE